MGTVSVRLKVGLDDLQGLFQPRQFCDLVIATLKMSQRKRRDFNRIARKLETPDTKFGD